MRTTSSGFDTLYKRVSSILGIDWQRNLERWRALFPAIALEPKAAFYATAYSAVPALIVGYGFYYLAPGFMN